MTPQEIQDYILAYPNPEPLRTGDIKIPVCQHRVSIESPCKHCKEIDRENGVNYE